MPSGAKSLIPISFTEWALPQTLSHNCLRTETHLKAQCRRCSNGHNSNSITTSSTLPFLLIPCDAMAKEAVTFVVIVDDGNTVQVNRIAECEEFTADLPPPNGRPLSSFEGIRKGCHCGRSATKSATIQSCTILHNLQVALPLLPDQETMWYVLQMPVLQQPPRCTCRFYESDAKMTHQVINDHTNLEVHQRNWRFWGQRGPCPSRPVDRYGNFGHCPPAG